MQSETPNYERSVIEADFARKIVLRADVESDPPLKEGGRGGTSGGMTGDWKTDVERQLAQLHGDVRKLLYGLVGGFVLLAGGGWVAYDKLNDQMTGFRAELSTTRIDQVKAIGEVQTRNAEINGKIDVLLERKKAAD